MEDQYNLRALDEEEGTEGESRRQEVSEATFGVGRHWRAFNRNRHYPIYVLRKIPLADCENSSQGSSEEGVAAVQAGVGGGPTAGGRGGAARKHDLKCI